MRLTFEIPNDLMESLLLLTGETDEAVAIQKALSEYVRRHKLDELRSMIGKMGLADNWREREETELAEMERRAP